VHLRQGYIEAGGNRKGISRLLEASKAPFRALVANIARLDATSADDLISRMQLGGASFDEVLTAADRLVEHVDRRRPA
jgi:hypothetical protein